MPWIFLLQFTLNLQLVVILFEELRILTFWTDRAHDCLYLRNPCSVDFCLNSSLISSCLYSMRVQEVHVLLSMDYHPIFRLIPSHQKWILVLIFILPCFISFLLNQFEIWWFLRIFSRHLTSCSFQNLGKRILKYWEES